MTFDAGGATLYDVLLFRTFVLYGLDAHDDQDVEGDHNFLLAIASPVLEGDDAYQAKVEELKAKVDDVPKGVTDSEWRRTLNNEHLGAIMSCLRKHGYLDRAPVPTSDVGEDYL